MSQLRRASSRQDYQDSDFRPILEVADELGLEHEQAAGGWHAALCPVHGDNAPSLRLNVAENWWMCYGCDTGGNAARLWAAIRGCSYDEALAATLIDRPELMVDAGAMLEPVREDADDAVLALTTLLVQRVRYGEQVDKAEWARVRSRCKCVITCRCVV